jgi:hypothetical protein
MVPDLLMATAAASTSPNQPVATTINPTSSMLSSSHEWRLGAPSIVFSLFSSHSILVVDGIHRATRIPMTSRLCTRPSSGLPGPTVLN